MTLLQSVQSIWRTVLFPESASTDSRSRFWHWLVLIVVPGCLLYSSLSFHLLEPDEGRYAQIPREILATGDWVVPTLQSEAYLDKPPLMYWLVAVSYSLFGISPLTARIIPAICVHLTILGIYSIGKRSIGSRAAFWAALLLTAAPGYLEMGRLLVLDGLLTCCVTWSLLCAYEAVRTGRFLIGWWLAAAVCSGLGFLTKGPIAEVLLLPPMVAVGWLSGLHARIGWRNYLVFGIVVLSVSLPWYVMIYRRQPEFLKYFFIDHNLMRFLQPFDHLQPIWFYVPVIIGGLLPALPLIGFLVRDLVFKPAHPQSGLSSSGGYWLAAGLWCVAFFSASGSKLPTYVLPAFPMLCLSLGEFVVRSQRFKLAGALIGLSVVGLFTFNLFVLPKYAKDRSPIGRPELVLPYVEDLNVPVVTYPRTVDSLAFAVGRRDFDRTRSRDSNQVILDSHFRPKTVVLFTHRHSYEVFTKTLPPSLAITSSVSLQRTHTGRSIWDKLIGDSPWGLCDIIVLEPVHPANVTLNTP